MPRDWLPLSSMLILPTLMLSWKTWSHWQDLTVHPSYLPLRSQCHLSCFMSVLDPKPKDFTGQSFTWPLMLHVFSVWTALASFLLPSLLLILITPRTRGPVIGDSTPITGETTFYFREISLGQTRVTWRHRLRISLAVVQDLRREEVKRTWKFCWMTWRPSLGLFTRIIMAWSLQTWHLLILRRPKGRSLWIRILR